MMDQHPPRVPGVQLTHHWLGRSWDIVVEGGEPSMPPLVEAERARSECPAESLLLRPGGTLDVKLPATRGELVVDLMPRPPAARPPTPRALRYQSEVLRPPGHKGTKMVGYVRPASLGWGDQEDPGRPTVVDECGRAIDPRH